MSARPLLLCAVLGVLAACGPAPVRYAAPLAQPGGRIAVPVASIEIRQVSLPTYALDEEIWVEAASGALTADPSLLWADEPGRGLTLELARQLGRVTGARVAAEPWPFTGLPEASVEVRADGFVAGADGRFRITGQVFTEAVEAGRPRARDFAVSAAIAPDSGAPGIAAARAAAVRDLARLIAREGF